jgi:hydroxypyruvate isomerase
VTAIRYCANISILFPDKPFLDRFALAAAAGFSHVEFWFPYEYPVDRLRAELQSHGLRLVLFNLSPGDFAAGDRGLLCDPARRDDFRRALDSALGIARELECSRINVMVGLRRADLPREEQRECIVENLRRAAPQAREAGVILLIEALNHGDMPHWFLTTSSEAWTILRDVGEPNVKFEFDFYHLQLTEGNLTQNFLAHLGEIGHVQIADVPGRHQPGSGEINYPFILQVIANSGYRGFVGLEYKPSGSTEESLAWLPRNKRAAD